MSAGNPLMPVAAPILFGLLLKANSLANAVLEVLKPELQLAIETPAWINGCLSDSS